MERALIAHVEIEQGIRFGLDHDQFLPYFEPQVDLSTGEIVGFEMLARWNHPLVGTDRARHLHSGCRGTWPDRAPVGAGHRRGPGQYREWDPALTLAVNISPMQLADPWLAQRIVRLLTEAGIAAERLVVEITESSLFADIELARSIATSLKNQGIRLALDDFGTGFSSLSHLRSLPFDVIKIDRSFIATINQDPESAAIVRAVTTLAEAIKVPVVVEGIEDAATHATAARLRLRDGAGLVFRKADERRPGRAIDQARAGRRPSRAAPLPDALASSTNSRRGCPAVGRARNARLRKMC